MRTLAAVLCFIAIYGMTTPARGTETTGDEAMARRLLNSQGCKACHRFEGGTTQIGPGLDKIGGKLSRSEFYSKLVNPEGRHGNGLIPDFSHLSHKEIDALANFLLNSP